MSFVPNRKYATTFAVMSWTIPKYLSVLTINYFDTSLLRTTPSFDTPHSSCVYTTNEYLNGTHCGYCSVEFNNSPWRKCTDGLRLGELLKIVICSCEISTNAFFISFEQKCKIVREYHGYGVQSKHALYYNRELDLVFNYYIEKCINSNRCNWYPPK